MKNFGINNNTKKLLATSLWIMTKFTELTSEKFECPLVIVWLANHFKIELLVYYNTYEFLVRINKFTSLPGVLFTL